MAAIPSGIIVLWPGTNSAISGLSGWSRETALDGKFPRSRTSGNAANGGNTSHNHPSSGHTHPGASHLHTGQSTGTTRTGSYNLHDWIFWPPVYGDTGAHIQKHTLTSSSNPFNASGNTTANWSNATHEPESYSMIAIVSDGTPTGFPDDCVVLYNASSAPTDWTQHAASVGKLLKMPTTSGNGGGSAGAANHTHNAAASHTHNAGSGTHDHSGGSVNGAYNSNQNATGSGCECGWTNYVTGHSHNWDLAAANQGSAGAATSGANASEGYTPPYHTLLGIQNTSGDDNWLEEAIVMWLGSPGSPPDDWTLCNGGNNASGNATPNLHERYIKFAASGGSDNGTASGAAGHNHGNPSNHTHPQSHSHALPAMPNSPGVGTTGTNNTRPNHGTVHGHLAGTGPTNNTAYGGAAQPSDNNSNTEPEYRTICFLSAPEEPAGGNVALWGSNF